MAITAAQLDVKVQLEGADKTAAGLRGIGAATDAAAKKGGAFGNIMSTAMGFVAGGLVLTGIGQINNMGKAWLGAGLSFEQGMANVQSVTGATGAEFKQLSDLALKIGKDTTFGANEATQAIEELAKGGLSTETILAGAADGAVALAAAGGVALPEAAAVMSQALMQFGLDGSQATHVADLLAAASATSATGVTELGQSLTYVGGTAASLGIPIEDVITSLAMMADQGLAGSMAGTALNNALMSMANPTAKAQQAMNDLGISFFDASGVMKPMPQILSELATATAGLTQEQRAAYLENIFGVEGARAMNALLVSQTEEAKKAGKGWEDYYKSVNQDGAAAEQAAARMNSTMGAIEGLKGSLETLAIITSMAVLPAFRSIIQGASGIVDGVSGFITSMQSYMSHGESFFTAFSLSARTALYNMFGVDGMNAIMPFVDGALDGLEVLISGIQAIAGVVGDALGSVFSFLADHIGTITGVILPAVAAFFALNKAIAAFQAVSAAAPAAISAIRMGLASMNPYVLAAAVAIGVLALAYKRNWFGIRDSISGLKDDIDTFFNGEKRADGSRGRSKWSEMKEGMDVLFNGDWTRKANVIKSALGHLGNGIQSLGKRIPFVGGAVTALGEGISSLGSIVPNIQKTFSDFVGQGMNPFAAGFATIGVGFQNLANMFPQFSGFFGGMRDQMLGFGAAAISIGDGVSKMFSGDFKGALQDFGTAASQVWDNVLNGAQTLWTGVKELGSAIGDLLGSVDWGNVASTLGNWALDGLQLAWDSISSIDWGQYIPDLDWGAVLGGAVDLASKFGDWVVNDIPWDTIITGIGDLASKFTDWVINDIPWKDIISDVGDVASKFTDWVVNDIPWKDILGTGIDLASKFTDWVVNDVPWASLVNGYLDIWSKFADWTVNDIPWSSLVNGYLDLWSKFADWTVNDIPWSSLISGAIDLGAKFTDWAVNDIPWSSIIKGTLDLSNKFGDWAVNDIDWSSIVKGGVDLAGKFGDWAVNAIDWKSILKVPEITGDFHISMPSVDDILQWIFGDEGSGKVDGTIELPPGAIPNDPDHQAFAPRGSSLFTPHGQQTTVTTTFEAIGSEAVAAAAAAVAAAVSAVPTSWMTTIMQAGGEAVAAVSNAATAAISAIPTSHMTAILQAGGEAVAAVANAAAAAINGIPTSHSTTLSLAGAGAVIASANAAAAAIAAIPTSVTTVVNTVTGAARAVGGYVTGGLTRLAEMGPELVALPNGDWFMAMRDALYPTPLGSYVYTAGQTSSMVAALQPVPAYAGGGWVGGRGGMRGGQASGGVSVTFTGDFYGSNRSELNEWARDSLIPAFRDELATHQRALGVRQ